MNQGSEFTDLTRCQVEALLECFDFLRNGYVQVIDFQIKGLWLIKMRHSRNGRLLEVWIHDFDYAIVRGGRTQKKVMFKYTPDKYRLSVNSDMTVGVVRTGASGNQNYIPGSLSTNKDAR